MMLPVSFDRLEVFRSKETTGWFTARILVKTDLGQEIVMFQDDFPHPGEATQAAHRQLKELLTNV